MTDTTETLSVGQQLKTAREALNLSILDVAQKTNLKKAHLEALEDDIFILPNVPPTFVRGYVRNYVRFLRLPETLVGLVNYGEVTIPKEVKRTISAPIPVKNNQKSQTRWVKALTWLILLGAIGMTLAWWWQEHKKEQASSEQLVSNAVEISSTTSISTSTLSTPSSTTENSVALPVAVDVKSQTQGAEASASNRSVVSANQTDSATSSAPQASNEIAVQLEPQATTAITQAVVDAQPTSTNENQTPAVAEPVNVLQQTPVAQATDEAESKAAEPAQAVNNDELRIEITNATSWITVRGVKNKKLAEKLYNSGEVLTFNGNEQYRLTIGAPANVKIYYKGQQVPLKVDGRVARFKLPLAK